MRSISKRIKDRLLAAQNRQGEAGQGIVEYLIIIAFIGLAVVLIVNLMGPVITNVFADFLEGAPVAPPDLIGYTRIPPTVTPTPDPNPILTLTLIDGVGGASGSAVSRNPGGTDLGSNQYQYTLNELVQLNPNPGAGYQFTGWGDALSGSNAPETILMDGNKTVSANFAQIVYTMTLNISGNGGVNVNGSPYIGPLTFMPNQSVSLQAIPGTNSIFLGWAGDLSSNNPNETVNMNGPKTINAFFQVGCYDLTPQTQTNPSGSGGSINIGTSPDCPGDPSKYQHGTVVDITAVPNFGYSFSGWSGDASGGNLTTQINMNAPKTVIASFDLIQYTLTANGVGGGTVAKSPDQAGYGQDQVVQLTANPDVGKVFVNWSGDISGSTNPYNLVMNADKTVTANFTDACYTLTLGHLPNGTGSVSANPTSSGSCPTGQYTYNTIVDLTATPNTGYQFANWSGAISGTNANAQVSMDSNKNITANFQPQCFDVTTSVNPGSSGLVALSPAPDCGTQYTYGTMVTFDASPASGYGFSNWSGDLTGTTNPDTLPINANTSVTANFGTCYSLSLTDNPAAGGSASASPTSSGGCPNGEYVAGTNVTLTASPNSGYAFSDWSGGLTSTNNPDTVPINNNTSVTANYNQGGNVLFVVGNTSLNNGDTAVYNRLQSLGYTVTTVRANNSSTSDANGKVLVLISSTCNSNDVNTKFRDVTVPVIFWEQALGDDMEVSTGGGTSGGQQQIDIIDSSHPLANGLSNGLHQVTNNNQTYSYLTNLASGAAAVATMDGNNSRYVIVGVDQGDALHNSYTAAARRVFLFMQDSTANDWTATGQGLFDKAVDWAINGGGGGGPSYINFNNYTISNYGGGSQAGNSVVTISGGGLTLNIVGNGWHSIDLPYTVTSNTVIEFDFSSSVEGEIQGIGFDNDSSISSNLTFQLYGTQNWGLGAFYNYSGSGTQHYVIPVGQYYTGNMIYLFFANDDDANGAGESIFSNVQIYEN